MAGYLLKYGSTVAYEPMSEKKSIHNGRLSMLTDAVSKFTFTMPPDNPIYDAVALHDFSHPVRLWFDDELLFQGYATDIAKDINLEKTVTCVSELQWLADVDIRIPDSTQANGRKRAYTARQLFIDCIAHYNMCVPDVQNFVIGHNVSAGAVGYLDSYSGRVVVDAVANTPTKILDVLKKSILDPYNCTLRVWYENGVRYIGLYAAPYSASNQVIRFGQNMTQFVDESSTADMLTGCYPVGGTHRQFPETPTTGKYVNVDTFHGKGSESLSFYWTFPYEEKVSPGDVVVVGDYEYDITNETTLIPGSVHNTVDIDPPLLEDVLAGTLADYWVKGSEYTTKPVTLEGWQNGTYYQNYTLKNGIIYDTGAVARYGLRTFTFSDSDILVPQDLMARAIAEIDQRINVTKTLSVDGVDMALYMSGYTHLLAGQKVRVVAEPHGVDETMVVSQADLNFDNPGQTKYTLGYVPNSATRLIKAAEGNTQDLNDLEMYRLLDTIPQEFIDGKLRYTRWQIV